MDKDLSSLFIESINEYLSELEEMILNLLKSNTYNKSDIDSLFRIVHTIKGTAGMFSAEALTKFAHKLEFFLDKVRHGKITLNQTILNLLLAAKDQMRLFIDDFENSINSDTSKADKIIAELEALSEADLKNSSSGIISSNKTKLDHKIDNEIDKIKANVAFLAEIANSADSFPLLDATINETIQLCQKHNLESVTEFLSTIYKDVVFAKREGLEFTDLARNILGEGFLLAKELLYDSLSLQLSDPEHTTDIDPDIILAKLQKPIEFQKKWTTLADDQKFKKVKEVKIYQVVFKVVGKQKVDDFQQKQIVKEIFNKLRHLGKVYILKKN